MVTMKKRVGQFFDNEVARLTTDLMDLNRAAGNGKPQDDPLLARLTASIHRTCLACRQLEDQIDEADVVNELQSEFQNAIEPWFQQSWFMDRARTKPRGCPGDYALLNSIYDGQVKSSGLGGYLDLYFLRSDLGRAVPARMESLRSFLGHEIAQSDRDLRIMNVACGPCREYFVGLDYPASRNVSIICIDSDEEALDHVRSRLSVSDVRADVRCVNYNALRMRSAQKNIRNFGVQDIIYSIGLLDYVPDRFLVPIMRGLRESLVPGGTLFVAFKDMFRYDKAEYQWFVDWFFYQRTEEECRRLIVQAGFDDVSLEMTRDATGVIMNFKATVPSMAKTIRVDQVSPGIVPARGSISQMPTK
jgi:extracellular factor (EF) 3-hydroxypalmitic acid methyl ester biosynthesis protein